MKIYEGRRSAIKNVTSYYTEHVLWRYDNALFTNQSEVDFGIAHVCIPCCVCCQELIDSVVFYKRLHSTPARQGGYVLCGHFERVKYFYIGKGMLFCLGECWIQLLQNMNSETLDAAGDMLAEWLSVELTSYHSSTYRTAAARGEPDNYSYLQHRSICRGITEYLQRLSQGTLEPSKIPVARQILRILSHNFPRILPPLNWTFLQQFLQQPDLCYYSLIIALKQASSSESGRRVIEMYLNSFDPSTENVSGILLTRHI